MAIDAPGRVLVVVYTWRRGRGPPGNSRITIRLDDDVSTWFREQVHAAGGGSYQTLINTARREYVAAKREPLEPTLRRVLREELPRVTGRGR